MSSDPKLLVVDDEEVICEGCRRIFTKQGFAVEKCSDACQGLALATQGNYCAILLDIKMPNMDGIEFLKALRQSKPATPVVLMTGYPSVPNAASAVRLGASDYVTKPFTPEEISQAVHRLLHQDGASGTTLAGIETWTPTGDAVRFWRDSWYQAGADGALRVGALLARPSGTKVESVALPRIGEVVYQGLPLAAFTTAGKPQAIVPSPVSGVVIAVNQPLESDPSALLADPCGRGWIACVSPTRLEEEATNCQSRPVILVGPDAASSATAAKRLGELGCQIRTAKGWTDLSPLLQGADHPVLVVDGVALGADGPELVGQINAAAPTAKIIVAAASEGGLEAAYRIRRIFYYAVEPFADNEIVDILKGAFLPPAPLPFDRTRELAQPLNSISITNSKRTRVRLLAAPGLLRREEGLGRLLRHRLMQKLFPIESSPDVTDITPMNLLSVASTCDRVLVLLVQDTGRLPGSLVRDTKSEFVSLSGKGADRVTTLVVQPSTNDGGPLAFDALTCEALAEHVIGEMASC
jgi:CheY-like chemotaxis protein/glycine cleavage system H lipoate-binding protein